MGSTREGEGMLVAENSKTLSKSALILTSVMYRVLHVAQVYMPVYITLIGWKPRPLSELPEGDAK